jgi:hypothetical protein
LFIYALHSSLDELACKGQLTKRGKFMLLEIEEIQEELQGRNYAEVGRAIGCTRCYVRYLATGQHVNPSFDLYHKLCDYIANNPKRKSKL